MSFIDEISRISLSLKLRHFVFALLYVTVSVLLVCCRDSSFGSTGDIPQSSTLRLHAKLDQPQGPGPRSAQAQGSILRLSTRLEAGEARTAFNEDQVNRA